MSRIQSLFFRSSLGFWLALLLSKESEDSEADEESDYELCESDEDVLEDESEYESEFDDWEEEDDNETDLSLS